MHNLFYKSDKKDNFLDGVLETLFFNVLNEDKPYRNSSVDELPGGRDIPYLNGGLFAKDGDDEKTCVFPEEYFKRLFDFLDSYNFTIDENDTEDAEIGIDPEMLGRIFESLLEDNKDKGAYYTPKEIVSYMCQESIIAYLQNPKFSDEGNALIRQFVETFDSDLLSIEQRRYVKDRLKSVKICDPAIGSGAFPMGIVNLLSKIYAALRLSTEPAEIKRHIMENSIYGVDIEKGAVDIARLRFWLAMIVEENEPMPLPNLHFKIMHGNSLIESYRGLDLSDLTQVNAQKSFWDSGNSERESLVSDLKRYYGESDHTERQRIFESIIKNVRRQIHAKDQNLSQKDFDPSDNDQFFLWHTWFTDVFEKGGFDIVIGNPPYVTKLSAAYKEYLGHRYPAGKKKIFDLYNFFMVLAVELIKSQGGTSTFIVPPTWLNNTNSAALRKYLSKNGLYKIVYLDNKVFNAVVDSCIYFASNGFNHENIGSYTATIKNTKIELFRTNSVSAETIKTSGSFIPKTESKSLLDDILKDCHTIPLGKISNIVFGIQMRKSAKDPSYLYDTKINKNCKPVLNGKHINAYYLVDSGEFLEYGDWLWNPRTPDIFESEEKILVRQVGKYPICAYDNSQYYTLNTIYNIVVSSKDFLTKYVLAILNSKLSKYIWKEIFPEEKDVFPRVKKEQMVKIPIALCNSVTQAKISKLVDKILEKNTTPNGDNVVSELAVLDILIYRIYGIKYEYLKEIDPDTPITRDEYENYKID
jgi:type I restriction-modification system DNA methylase subunit